MSKKPNILFIFTDQQRADTMGYADDPVALTPHTDRLASEGVVFRRCCTNSPVCMTDDPWDAPAEYRRRYDADAMSLSITDAQTGPVSPHVEMLLKFAPQKLDRMSEAENRVMKSYYYAKVSLIDDCVGRVVAALENRGWLNDTWIVFSSDHGEMLGDHGLMAKKVFYDGAVNVPCIFRPPSGGAGWQSNALTDHLDITATLLDVEPKRLRNRMDRPCCRSSGQARTPPMRTGTRTRC